jgi:hypothetical protein
VTLQRSSVSLPFIAGADPTEGAATRQAPSLAQALDVVPGRHGSLVTRDGLQSIPLDVRDAAVGIGVAYTQALAVDPDGGNATVWCGGRAHRCDATLARGSRPRYSEITWTANDIADPLIAEASYLWQSSVLRYLDARGRSWVVVAQVFHSGSVIDGAPIRLVMRWYCDGSEVCRQPYEIGSLAGQDDWLQKHRNGVAMDAHYASGYADYVLVGWGSRTGDGVYGYALMRFDADDPAAGATLGEIDPTDGALTAWDIVGVNSASSADYWCVAYGTSTGYLYSARLALDMGVNVEDVLMAGDATPITSVRVARGTSTASNLVGVAALKESSVSTRAYGVISDRGALCGVTQISLEIAGNREYCTHVDVAGYDDERFLFAASRLQTDAALSLEEAWTDFRISILSGSTATLLRDSRIYGVGAVALSTIECGRVVAALRDPGAELAGRRYPCLVTGGYTAAENKGPTHYGRAVLIELGDLSEATGYGDDYWRAHMICGATYQGSAWDYARGRFDPSRTGGYVGVVLSSVLLDPYENFPVANTPTSRSAGALGVISLQAGEQCEVAETPALTVFPGGAPTAYPTHYAAATLGFPTPPRASAANVGSGVSPTGTLYFRCIYRRQLPNGQTIVSEPSNVVSAAAPTPATIYLDATPTTYGPSISETEIVWYYSSDGIAFSEIAPRYSANVIKNNPTAAYVRATVWAGASIYDITSSRLYTDGGVLPSYLPPSATQAVHWQRRVWLCGGHRELWYSRELVPGEAPAWHPALTLTIGRQRITAIQPLGERLVIWTETGTYLLAGDGPGDNGAGGWQQPALLLALGVRLGDSCKTASGRSGAWFWGSDEVLRQITISGEIVAHAPWSDAPQVSYLDPSVSRITSSVRTGEIRVNCSLGLFSQPVSCYHEDAKIWTQINSTMAAFADALAIGGTSLTSEAIRLRRDGETCDSSVTALGGTPTLYAISPVVRMTGLTFDGAVGHQRLYAAELMVRTSELWSWTVEIDTDGYGGDVADATRASSATVQPDTGAFTGIVNTERFRFFAGTTGGLWSARIRAGVARGQSADVAICANRIGYAPGGVASPVALAATEPRQEFVALGVEFGKRLTRGRGADSANG